MVEAAYLKLFSTGELAERARLAHEALKDCDLCARYCHVNRLEGVRGAVCRTGEKAQVSSFGPHHGEEAPLSGRNGSGTIFFTWCNMRCVFCQNFDISWPGEGQGEGAKTGPEQLAAMMLTLQRQGCHNINFVSPSHVVAQILEALVFAAEAGLSLPLVYNTGGFDSAEALKLLDGVIDIYMPDLKYGSTVRARKYSKIRGYVAHNQAAVREMHRQVGDLILDEKGVAERGLLVRHLVLPGGCAGSEEVMRFLAEEISVNTYLNILSQYRPCHRASDYPELRLRPSGREFQEVFDLAKGLGLNRLDERVPAFFSIF